MLTAIHPKLPMRDPVATRSFYIALLGFQVHAAFHEYLILQRDAIEIHFFLHPSLDPLTNDGQVYIRTNNIQALYRHWLNQGVPIHPNSPLAQKPWGQWEFALLDPDHNLLTFGSSVN